MAAAKLLLVVLLAAAYPAQAQDRIKMCGRELIRLAVSSCGNSRLRRSILDTELSQQQLTAGWNRDASAEEDQAAEKPHPPPHSEEERSASSLAPHWHPLTFRIRRSAGKISDICCEKGCSMKELIQFC
ncbi:PREDICTED: relaxin-3-like [Cyprinodon variegatus]|uniref:relaxin-3-like n=1 Tax=Cyprinodon variegatus TaxID=28743 RepID=UPI0007427031|nr:PREDICTED: relaxin-3-like [Cyprinodon variegatus]